MEKDKKYKTSMRNFIIALILLLATNVMMGVTMMLMAKSTIKSQVEQRMLDVANSAASQLDGDSLKSITEQNIGSDEYNREYKILRSFQDNIKLDYIYTVKPHDDGTFSFIIDPDPEDPGDFGEKIQRTQAIVAASKGTPSVDKEPHKDYWGNFYSAYSPVYDSNKNVVAIVGVDFDANWYGKQTDAHKYLFLIMIMVAMIIGIVLAFIMMSQNRTRFATLMKNLEKLNIEALYLDNTIMQSAIKKLDNMPETEVSTLKMLASGESRKNNYQNEYEEAEEVIEQVYDKLHKYVDYITSEVCNDTAVGVLNKGAYKEKVRRLDDSIKLNRAKFSVAFFDVNDIHKLYTNYGYEEGDTQLFKVAKIVKEIFGEDSVYHITGPELVVIAENKGLLEMEEGFEQFDKNFAVYLSTLESEKHFFVGKGRNTYVRGEHTNYRQVFIGAKQISDRDVIYHTRLERGKNGSQQVNDLEEQKLEDKVEKMIKREQRNRKKQKR
ncbi:MAG: diguanylate cyclase [Lachnospiraceae bacterium]|nr:diguanylate cyclase [Lachnospiraceae bacterium]